MSTVKNLHVDAGRDYDFAARYLNSLGQPHNLSTATITAQIRSRYPTDGGAPAPVAEFTTSGDVDGWFHLTLTGAQSAMIPPGTYVYDVLLVAAGGARPPLLRGSVVVSPSVTVVEDES